MDYPTDIKIYKRVKKGPGVVYKRKPTITELAKRAIYDPVQVRREINDRSFYEFFVYFWPEMSNDELKDNWHLEYLCNAAQEVIERVGRREPKKYDLVINVPPGMTKTKIFSIALNAWAWTRWIWMQFITASYSAPLALENADATRDLLKSDKFRMIYPEIGIKEDKDTKSNFRVVRFTYARPGHVPRRELGGWRLSTSVGGTATGFHGHVQIVDDPINPKQAISEAGLRTANHFIDETLSTRKTDKKITVLILIMQRLHQDDPSGHLLKKKGKKIKHICLPGEIRNYAKYVRPIDALKYYKDGLLDPVRLDWDDLKEARSDLGQYGFAGQFGQNPTPPGGGMFRVGKFQIVTSPPNPGNIIETVRYWDKAGTVDGGAFTVGVKFARLRFGSWIVLDVKRGQWGSNERERIIRATAEADGVDVRVIVEQEPGSGGKESAENTVKNLAGFTTVKDRPTGDKALRADPYSVQVNDGNVQLLFGEWNHEFIEEHRYFPYSTYKDQVDAAAGAFNYITSRRVARRIT